MRGPIFITQHHSSGYKLLVEADDGEPIVLGYFKTPDEVAAEKRRYEAIHRKPKL